MHQLLPLLPVLHVPGKEAAGGPVTLVVVEESAVAMPVEASVLVMWAGASVAAMWVGLPRQALLQLACAVTHPWASRGTQAVTLAVLAQICWLQERVEKHWHLHLRALWQGLWLQHEPWQQCWLTMEEVSQRGLLSLTQRQQHPQQQGWRV